MSLWDSKILQTWTGRKFYLNDLVRAYHEVPSLVLKDLADFCRFYHPSGSVGKDPYETYLMEGRRQVFQRMLNHLHLDDAQIMALYTDRQVNIIPKE